MNLPQNTYIYKEAVNFKKKLIETKFKEPRYKVKAEALISHWFKKFEDIVDLMEIIEVEYRSFINFSNATSIYACFDLSLVKWMNFKNILIELVHFFKNNPKPSVNKFFKEKKKGLCRKNFYNYRKHLKNFLKNYLILNQKTDVRNFMDFSLIAHKPTKPNRIKHKYTKEQKQELFDAYYLEYDKFCLNLVDYTMRLKNNEIIYEKNINKKENEPNKLKYTNENNPYSNICVSTVRKFINELNGEKPIINHNKKHLLRPIDLSIGKIQFDIKHITYTESGAPYTLYLVDAKSINTKIYKGFIYKEATEENVLDALAKIINYFESKGEKIQSIQTDNGSQFKKTISLNSGRFHDYLCSLNITHRFITAGQPQENGVIERHHQIIDKEFSPVIRKNYEKDIEPLLNLTKNDEEKDKFVLYEINEYLNTWCENFNSKRYHTFTFRQNYSKTSRTFSFYEKPIKMLKQLKYSMFLIFKAFIIYFSLLLKVKKNLIS